MITLSNKTRDKKIRVMKDLKTKIIFLEKYITSNEYYSLLKYKDDGKGCIGGSLNYYLDIMNTFLYSLDSR